MAACRPGVGDPLGYGNPYADGRPNWNLQTKARTLGPPDNLTNNMNVAANVRPSPYAQDFPDKYKVQKPACADGDGTAGRRHYVHHLAKTTTEQVDRGLGIPDHLAKGEDRPDRPTGRKYIAQIQKNDPKDGGIWEPVRREYPKVQKTVHGSGARVVPQPIRDEKPVDIWPTTITVRDQFKPGGIKMLPKRGMNTEAFPGCIGYESPKDYDSTGRRIDYSNVKNGGPFGLKMLHKNEGVPLRAETMESWKVTRNEQSMFKTREGELTLAKEAAAKASEFAEKSRSSARSASLRPPSGVRAELSATTRDRSLSGTGVRMSPTSGEPKSASIRPDPLQPAVKSSPKVFEAHNKPRFEHPLWASTAWTFMGGYRP